MAYEFVAKDAATPVIIIIGMSGETRPLHMDSVSFKIGRIFCHDCVRALQRFVGSMKGVDRLEVQGPHVVVYFDPSANTREFIDKVTRESIEKLGYRVETDN